MSTGVTPSRMNLQLFKAKTQAARKGHELLKRKCDALKTKFRTIMIGLLDNKKKMGDEVQEALLLFAQAQWAAGEFGSTVRDSVKRATVRVDFAGENIAGVILPILSLKEFEDSDSNLNQIGIDRGGQQIQKCREKFRELLVLLVNIASFQTSFISLDEVIKVTNRRVNALEHVVIPRFVGIMNYINQELDEISREEYFRLKKVLDNKKKMIIEEEAEKKKRTKELEAQTLKGMKFGGDQGGNLLDEEHDEDLLF